jgi:hypothetical protein
VESRHASGRSVLPRLQNLSAMDWDVRIKYRPDLKGYPEDRVDYKQDSPELV